MIWLLLVLAVVGVLTGSLALLIAVEVSGTVEKLGRAEMGSVHWEVEVLAKRIQELIPDIEWNRDEDGRITGIVHTMEVNLSATNEVQT